jgi:hypothetical protein
VMMHKGQTHIKRNCFSIGIISSKYKVGVTWWYMLECPATLFQSIKEANQAFIIRTNVQTL